jgi:hypothetical protein
LWLLVFIVIAVAVFLATVKVLNPNFNIENLVGQKAVQFVNSEIIEKIENSESTTTTTTKPTTTAMVDYLEFDEFEFDSGLQGGYVGNLLNGGMVANDSSYIYHAVDGKGIYRFSPSSEQYTKLYASSDKIRCINNRGDFLYFVNADNNKLYKLQKGNTSAKEIASNVKFAYCYDSNVYFITTNNELCIMNVKELSPNVIYTSNDDEMNFVGISLNRVFFTVTQYDGSIEYLSVDNEGKQKPAEFRKSSDKDAIALMELENGFLYYYEQQDDGTYNLCRQKFGSENIVKLVENASVENYAEIASNRLYYTKYSNGKLKMKELNMNSNESKTLLSINKVKDSNTLKIYHGGEYDFVIGKKSEDGKKVYSASTVYSSSTNTMQFKNGKWSYAR